jgi:methionyl-tRNA formyltransferase
MRFVYFGSGDFGLPTFEALQAKHETVLVVSQPDRPAGRNRVPTPTPIAARATELDLPVFRPEKPNEADAIERIHAADADAFVVIAYGHKLSDALLGEHFAINLHASLLPKYRGAAPINWAMINDEPETGVSVITLAQTMDAGGVLARRVLPIKPLETAGELHDRLAQLGPEAVLETLDRFEQDRLEIAEQDPVQATRAPKFTKSDGTVSFDQPARLVRARVHGLTPWPGCTVTVNGDRLRLHRVRDVAGDGDGKETAATGALLENGRIACFEGAIEPLEVQPPGGRVMTFDDYRRGRDLQPGARFEPLQFD